jgi:hypothetical protein
MSTTVEEAIAVLLAEWEARERPSELCDLAITLSETAHNGRRFLRFGCRSYTPGAPPARELLTLPVNWSEASAVYNALQSELYLLRQVGRKKEAVNGRRRVACPVAQLDHGSDRANRYARDPARAAG